MENCYICNSGNSKIYVKVKNYVITHCNACDHGQLNPIPSNKELEELYKNATDDSFCGNGCSTSLKEKYKSDRNFLKKYYSDRLGSIEKLNLNKDAAILDFGCTNGLFVKAIEDNGHTNVYGYDIAEDLVEEGKKEGLKLFSGDLEAFATQFEGKFDAIVSYDVFEHLADPRAALKSAHKLLKKDGYLVVRVPYLGSLQGLVMKEKSPIIDPPFHIQYYSRKSMKSFFNTNNFTTLSQSTPFWGKQTDTYLELKGVSLPLAKALRIGITPVKFIIEFFNLGGNLLNVTRKN